MNQKPAVSISIVSHGQGELVAALLSDISAHCTLPLEIILTLNIPETLTIDTGGCHFPVKIIRNTAQKGFGANHNAAFGHAAAAYFCVLNPDIRIARDPFPQLIELLADQSIGVAAPLIVNPAGGIEDSARRFPTPAGILRKLLSGSPGPDYVLGEAPVYPDWVAGMFMMFRVTVFRAVDGFDEGYFLYYEDVDLCWRMGCKGWRAALLPTAQAMHDARRTSHRNLRYLSWHGKSMLLFFAKRALGLR